MSVRCLLAAALLFAAPAAFAQAQLVPASSEIVFTTRQMGVPVDGRFTRYTARVALDPKKPEAGSIALGIDTGSTRFGAAELEAEVAKPGWLGAVKFPQASFQSSAIRAVGPGRFEVTGQLAIKGVTRELVVPVQLQQSGALSTASGSFTLKRLQFGIGDGDWNDPSLVADEVQVRFRLVLSGLAPL